MVAFTVTDNLSGASSGSPRMVKNTSSLQLYTVLSSIASNRHNLIEIAAINLDFCLVC